MVTCDNTFFRPGVGHVYAFDQATGSVRWKHRDETGIPTDVIRVGKSVFVVTMSDELVCLDLGTGRLRWTVHGRAKELDRESVASPATDGERVYWAARDKTLYALAAASGEEAWLREFEHDLTTTPIVAEGRLWLGTAGKRLHAIEPIRGKAWKTVRLPGVPGRVPVYWEGVLLVFLGERELAGIDARTAEILWTAKMPATVKMSRPCAQAGIAWVGDTQGHLHGFSIRDGRLLHEAQFEGEDLRSVGATADAIYIGTLDGSLYAQRMP